MARKKVVLKKPVVRRSSQAASKKTIISTGTLVTLVVFAAVILLGIYLARQKETAGAEATPAFEEPKFLFTESDLTLSSIELVPGEGETVKLVRDDKNVWAFELPAKVEADQGLIEAAASQIPALMVVDTLPDAKPSDFGFDKPAYVITLKFDGGKTYVLEVGDASPINTGYYVRLDKGVIQLVDLSGIDALTQLATTPPYVATPTPLTTPTATALPPTETAIPTETASTPEVTSETTQTASTPEVTSEATSVVTPEATSAASPIPTEAASTPEASPTPTP